MQPQKTETGKSEVIKHSMNGENKYVDIIKLPHHTSATRKKMSQHDRAAQFSPFAALTGHSEALYETARMTESKIELDECEKLIINEKLQMIMNVLPPKTEVTVEYFVPDSLKNGGTYIRKNGFVKKIDSFRRELLMSDGTKISADNILDIEISEKY